MKRKSHVAYDYRKAVNWSLSLYAMTAGAVVFDSENVPFVNKYTLFSI